MDRLAFSWIPVEIVMLTDGRVVPPFLCKCVVVVGSHQGNYPTQGFILGMPNCAMMKRHIGVGVVSRHQWGSTRALFRNGVHWTMGPPIWGYGWTTDGYISLPGPLLEYTQGACSVKAIHLHGGCGPSERWRPSPFTWRLGSQPVFGQATVDHDPSFDHGHHGVGDACAVLAALGRPIWTPWALP